MAVRHEDGAISGEDTAGEGIEASAQICDGALTMVKGSVLDDGGYHPFCCSRCLLHQRNKAGDKKKRCGPGMRIAAVL